MLITYSIFFIDYFVCSHDAPEKKTHSLSFAVVRTSYIGMHKVEIHICPNILNHHEHLGLPYLTFTGWEGSYQKRIEVLYTERIY